MKHSDLPVFIQEKKDGTLRVIPNRLASYARDFYKLQVVRSTQHSPARLFAWYPEGVYKEVCGEVLRGMLGFLISTSCPSLVSTPVLQETERLLRNCLDDIPEDQLNACENFINLKNGMLFVSSGLINFMPHDETYLSTIQFPVSWEEELKPTPNMDAFLASLSNGNREVLKVLWEVIGVVCSNLPVSMFKQCPVLVGKGNTGKSVLFNLLTRMVGQNNCFELDLGAMEKRFGSGYLYQKRLCGCPDMSYQNVGELKLFKQITGGDSIFAEGKGSAGFTFHYRGMLLYCCNRMPRFGGDQGKWVYNRFLPIPCDREVPPEEQDKNLLIKLLEEKDAIFRKSMIALQRVMENNFAFDEPEVSTRMRSQYRLSNAPGMAFREDCLGKTGEEGVAHRDFNITQIYRVYKRWCGDQGIEYQSFSVFKEELAEALGVVPENLTERKSNGKCIPGYTLKEDAVQIYMRER